MNTKNPTQKYRDKMKRAGFRYMCMWVHKDDVEAVRLLTEPRRVKWAADQLGKLADSLSKKKK